MKMKKGIIAIALLLSGALLITPITTNANSTENSTDTVVIEEVNNTDKTEVSNELKDETTYKEDIQENKYKSEINNNQPIKVETTQEEIVKDTNINTSDEVVEEKAEECGMTKADAEVVLNNYLSVTNQANKLLNLSSSLDKYIVITIWKARFGCRTRRALGFCATRRWPRERGMLAPETLLPSQPTNNKRLCWKDVGPSPPPRRVIT